MVLRTEVYEPLVQTALDEAKQQDLYAIVRVQDKKGVAINITNGVTQAKLEEDHRGMGVTVFTKDGAVAHGSTDVLSTDSVKALLQTLGPTAKESAKYDVQKNTAIFDVPAVQAKEEVPVQFDMGTFTLGEQESYLQDMHASARAIDEDLSSASTRYANNSEHWHVARSDGTSVHFSMPMSRIFQTFTKRKGDKTLETYIKISGVDSAVLLEGADLYNQRSEKSVQLLNDLLVAQGLPSGSYKSLLTTAFSGLLAHEAVGHPAESDLVRTGILGEDGRLKLGQKVAPVNISYVDGPVEGEWGDVRYSMNGLPRREVAFIKNGVVVNSLSDVFSAGDIGVDINGCGRAQTFHHVTVPRMSNTRIVDSKPFDANVHPDHTTPEQLYHVLRSMGELNNGEKVLLPVLGMGGQVSTEEGNFMFGAAGAYLIEHPFKITLYGSTTFGGSTLGAVKAHMRGIGNSLDLSNSGMCGKAGQGAPVSDGSHPYLLMYETPEVTYSGE